MYNSAWERIFPAAFYRSNATDPHWGNAAKKLSRRIFFIQERNLT